MEKWDKEAIMRKNYFEELMGAINELQNEVAGIRADVDALKEGKTAKTTKSAKTAPKKATTTKTATKSTAKKSAKKQTAPKTAKTQTWTEKKAEFAKQFTDEERAEYGFRKSLERKAQKFVFELTNAEFEERVDRKVWKKAYNENLEAINNVVEGIIEQTTDGAYYTDNKIILDFIGTVDRVKKVRSDRKGFTKFVRA